MDRCQFCGDPMSRIGGPANLPTVCWWCLAQPPRRVCTPAGHTQDATDAPDTPEDADEEAKPT